MKRKCNCCDGLDDVLFLVEEPCLYLEKLIECVDKLREQTNLKLYLTTSVLKFFMIKEKYLNICCLF